jgi:hypothetical protein
MLPHHTSIYKWQQTIPKLRKHKHSIHYFKSLDIFVPNEKINHGRKGTRE